KERLLETIRSQLWMPREASVAARVGEHAGLRADGLRIRIVGEVGNGGAGGVPQDCDIAADALGSGAIEDDAVGRGVTVLVGIDGTLRRNVPRGFGDAFT